MSNGATKAMRDNQEDMFVDASLKQPNLYGAWNACTARVWFRAKFRCEYCDRTFTDDPHYSLFQVDHLLPQSKHPDWAGCDEPNLYALACMPCNLAKRSREFFEEGDVQKLMSGDRSVRECVVKRVKAALKTERESPDRREGALRQLIPKYGAMSTPRSP